MIYHLRLLKMQKQMAFRVKVPAMPRRGPILPHNPQPLLFIVLVTMVVGFVIVAGVGVYFISIWAGVALGASWDFLCMGCAGWVLKARKFGAVLLGLGVILASYGLYLAVH